MLGYAIMGLLGLIIIGIVIILLIRLFIIIVPAAIAAFIVWFLTGNLWWAGLTFLGVSLLSLLKKLL
ncbi:MAG: hypothetical protein PVF96_07315 [Candidatus Bathyarchaeota archaeon]